MSMSIVRSLGTALKQPPQISGPSIGGICDDSTGGPRNPFDAHSYSRGAGKRFRSYLGDVGAEGNR